ncbi:MAG: hypothetical protein ABW128_23660 [Rhizorhabdus sp.]
MPNQDERGYHLARQRECEVMARQAINPAARLAHETLAKEHQKRANPK